MSPIFLSPASVTAYSLRARSAGNRTASRSRFSRALFSTMRTVGTNTVLPPDLITLLECTKIFENCHLVYCGLASSTHYISAFVVPYGTNQKLPFRAIQDTCCKRRCKGARGIWENSKCPYGDSYRHRRRGP